MACALPLLCVSSPALFAPSAAFVQLGFPEPRRSDLLLGGGLPPPFLAERIRISIHLKVSRSRTAAA